MSHQDAALSLLLSQHNAEQQQIALQEELNRLSTENAKLRAAQRAANPPKTRGSRAPIHSAKPLSAIALGDLPDKGSLSAKDFMLAVRTAGRRLRQDGMPYTNQGEVRGDLIRAIHGFYFEIVKGETIYKGYDPRLDFGTQDNAARQLAQRVILGKVVPGMDRASVKSAERSMSGYVHGSPNYSHKAKGNIITRLEGRASLVREIIITCQRTGDVEGEAAAQADLSDLYKEIEDIRVAP